MKTFPILSVAAASVLLSGCLCMGLKDAYDTTKAKPTIVEKASLAGLRSAALAGVCHMDEMGVTEGIKAHDRISVGSDASEQMTKAFAGAFADALGPVAVTSLDDALAKAEAAVRGTVPAHAACLAGASPFKEPAEKGLMKSIEPVLDVEHLQKVAQALDVDAAFAVMMVPALEVEEQGVKMWSSGIIHATIYGVDRSGKIIFQQPFDPAGSGKGAVTRSTPDFNGRYTISFAPGSIAEAAGHYCMDLATGLKKAIAAAR